MLNNWIILITHVLSNINTLRYNEFCGIMNSIDSISIILVLNETPFLSCPPVVFFCSITLFSV